MDKYTVEAEKEFRPKSIRAARDDFLIQYNRVDYGPLYLVQVYENDTACVELGWQGKEVKKNVSLPRGKSKELAERLVKAGFYKFQDAYHWEDTEDEEMLAAVTGKPYDASKALTVSTGFDGPSEGISLNWQGRSKTVECDRRRPNSPEFAAVLEDLLKIGAQEQNG